MESFFESIINLLVVLIAGGAILFISNKIILKIASLTKTSMDNRIIESVKPLCFITIIIAGVYSLLLPIELPIYSDEVKKAILYLASFLFVVIIARTLRIVLEELFMKAGVPRERSMVTANIIHFSIMSLGGLAILSSYIELIMPFAVSLGIIGFALTFSLQYPLANFMGWVDIMTSKIYKVGDLVKIGDSRGIVLSIGYLTTQIAERDDYGHQSGRILTVPNSTALTTNILNWVNPAIYWDNLPFAIAYESELGFVEETMLRIIDELYEKLGTKEMLEKYEATYHKIGVDKTVISIDPYVLFEPAEGGWIAAKLMYPVLFEESIQIKTSLTQQILKAFNENAGRVMFPVGSSR